MLRISMKESETSLTMQLHGRLSEEWAEEFRDVWLKTHELRRGKKCEIDLAGVTFIDEKGRSALDLALEEAAQLRAKGALTSYIVERLRAAHKKNGSPAKLLILLLLVVLPSAAPQQAEAQDPGILKLSMAEAVQTALRQNPQVQIGNIHLALSMQDRAIAASDLMPHAGARISESAVRGNSEALIGQKLPYFPKQMGPFQVFEAGGGVSSPVFDLTLWRKWQAAGHTVQGAGAQERGIREQITLLVVSQYLGCLRSKAALKASESRMELAEALYKQASDLQENGVGTGLDTLRANVQLQAEKQRRIFIETQLKTGLLGLARLLNLDSSRTIELTSDAFLESAAPAGTKLSLDEALTTRPEMEALKQKEAAVQSMRRAADDSRLPSIHASAAWAYQGLSLPSSIPVYEYRLTLNLPIFTGGRIRAERAKADLELKKTAQEKQEMRNQITLQVRVAEAEIEAAKNEVEVARLAVSLAKEEVAQARDRFQAGVANNLEVINAQNELARANENEINSLYRLSQARADLARATGQMEDLYSN